MARVDKRQVRHESTQVERFKEAARALGCDDDEAAFDAKLKRIAGQRPAGAKDQIAKPGDKGDKGRTANDPTN